MTEFAVPAEQNYLWKRRQALEELIVALLLHLPNNLPTVNETIVRMGRFLDLPASEQQAALISAEMRRDVKWAQRHRQATVLPANDSDTVPVVDSVPVRNTANARIPRPPETEPRRPAPPQKPPSEPSRHLRYRVVSRPSGTVFFKPSMEYSLELFEKNKQYPMELPKLRFVWKLNDWPSLHMDGDDVTWLFADMPARLESALFLSLPPNDMTKVMGGLRLFLVEEDANVSVRPDGPTSCPRLL